MSLRVSALQLKLTHAHSSQEFFDCAREPIECAAASGAQLIVLPICDAPERCVAEFSSLAARLQIYLAPGTMIEREGDALYNTAYLFAPDGKLVGTQRQTHRAPQEIARGLAQGDELNVFDIGIARVGFVIGTDVEYPEVSRILALQGANVLIHPASYATWSEEHFLLDLWREVQSNQVFGVQACAVGQGQSAIYTPVELTEDHQGDLGHRGFLAQAANKDTEEIIGASLDFGALQKVVDGYPIFDFFNYEFYAREFPQAYKETGIQANK